MLHETLAAEARKNDGLDGVRLAALDRARPLVDLLARRGGRAATQRGIRQYLAACTVDERRAAVLCLMLATGYRDLGLQSYESEIGELMPRTSGWTPEEAAVLLRAADDGMEHFLGRGLEVALTAAERLDADGRRELVPWLRHAHRGLRESTVEASRRGAVTKRLMALLADADEAVVPEGMVPMYDTWAGGLRERVSRGPDAELVRFLRHLETLSGPRPSQKWRRTCVALADAADARGAVAGCLRGLAEDAPVRRQGNGYQTRYLVHESHGELARGIVWAATLTGGPETVPFLGALALRVGTWGGEVSGDLKLAGAAINALAAVEDASALEELWRLEAKIKDRALRKQVGTALRTAAERQGITPEQLVERSVPSHGLGPGGAVERTLGEHVARIAIEDAATVRLTFTGAGGRPSRTAPAAVKDGFAGELKELKALAKEVRGTLSAERARVEAIMSDGTRVWPYGEWREHYRDHPVTGTVARGLIWEFQGEDGAWRAALGAALGAADGEPADGEPADGEPANVRLWHPARAALEEVRAWRERVVADELRQPFKQAFREIYLLTPAEEETRTYSNRFAAHIVHYRRLYALIKERGWQSNFLGPHEGGYNGEARGEFGGGAWRACFYHDPADDDYRYEPDHAATDQVRFERKDGRRWQEAPLADVPPLVFSEAMRDVDLFVGVTSIAADPDWEDHGDDRYQAYWRKAAFGGLTASAEVRRAALERILPRTRIAGRCSLDGRFLVVRGELRTYKIHLGSANVLMEPDDAYLCIVEGGRRAGGKVYLPFEDERLSLILSKAFLLAADHKITDGSILRQLSSGR